MKREEYEAIVAALTVPIGSCPNLNLLRTRFPNVMLETFISIFSQENQAKVIKSHHIHKSNLPVYCERYLAGTDILELSASVDFPPCLLLRRMIEHLFSLGKQVVGDIMKDPARLVDAVPDQGEDSLLLIGRLQYDVVRTVLADRCYSPHIDIARQAAGLEYELLLFEKLRQANIPFWSEADLHHQGMFKTPDVRLQVPIAVRGRIVTWIDSKATFGDDQIHHKQLEQQYRTYVNRYGSGLVIYWFGFVDELNTDLDVMLLDRFPHASEIQTLPRFPAKAT